jgi:MFS family permease
MMASPALFTASRNQTLTYLLAVCPFSIAFLVFINSSISFVVTNLIGLEKGEGNAVGSLGFADELLALAACPLWGVLSDRIGVRHVSFRFLLAEAISL